MRFLQYTKEILTRPIHIAPRRCAREECRAGWRNHDTERREDMAARVEWKPAAAPVCKWSGGKRQLLPHLIASRPSRWRRYLEPFVGGGALFFALGQPDSYISDTNAELINMYRVLRDDVDALVEHLGRHRNESSYYYAVRAQDPAHLSPLERASRLLFLLRVCYNGLWRENAAGQMNTPFGRYHNPDIVQEKSLRAAHHVLKTATIAESDYRAVARLAEPGDWVYLDPPYAPVSKTANFTSYTAHGFNWADQEAMAQLVREMGQRGVFVMTSNADVPAIHDLYHGLPIQIVPARRAINSNPAKRTGITEVIITSYPVS